jgi:multicomponent Na+:H+ antiporter subunit D
MESQLPALVIVVPLIAAPICIVLRRPGLALGFALAVVWTVFAMAIKLELTVLDQGVVTYAMGDWRAPWGIEYRLDTLGSFVMTLVSGMGAVVLTYARRSLASEIPRDKLYLFLSTYLLAMTGLLGICITGDLFNLFVFLEISALSSYALISMGKDRRALTAAFQYLILGTIGATFVLIGIGLTYMMTGTLNMADMAARIGEVGNSRTVFAAFGFRW